MESNKLKGKRLKAKGIVVFCLVSCFLILVSAEGKAQSFSFSDLFGQGGKEIKNTEQQLTALIAFENSVRQGYNMLHNEWSSIANWKNGEFGLHQTYYTSLSQVNPVVKNATDLTTIQAEQQSIISQFNGISNVIGLTANEQTYIGTVQQNVLSQCSRDMTDLQNVLTPGKLVMSDDERIIRINKLAAAIKDKYLFICHFTAQVKLLAASRTQDTNEVQTLNQLYGIN